MNILIVDDDPVMILELRNVLKPLGSIFVASSGQSAVATACDVLPELIVLDIGLPDIAGFDPCLL